MLDAAASSSRTHVAGWLEPAVNVADDSVSSRERLCEISDSSISDGDCSTSDTQEDSLADVWADLDHLLLRKGYVLHAVSTRPPSRAGSQIRPQRVLKDYEPYDAVRPAMSKRTRQRLFIKVCRTVDAAEQLKALRLLNEPRLLADPRNRVIRLLDTFQAPFRGSSVTFFVHPEAGVPCCEIDWLRTDDCMWICFVHQLFKTLDLFHECGIAHLDIQAGNVLYDTKTARISVIDWHGCQTHDSKSSLCRPPLSANAQLPELFNGPFDPWKADVWCMGKMLVQLRPFPEDDLASLLRFMTITEPSARPSIRYCLHVLEALLASSTDAL